MKVLKISLVFAAFMFSGAIFAKSISDEQQLVILNDLNDICGDTWCESEFRIQFTSFTSTLIHGQDAYTLNLVAYNLSQQNPPPQFVSCEILNAQIIHVLSNDNGTVDLSSYREELYNTVDSCVYNKLLSY